MGGSSVPQASWILPHIEYFGWQAFVTVLLLPRGNVPWAKLKNIILLFKAARSLMQIFLYFSTLEIHSGSTMCEMSFSWIRCHRATWIAPVCLRVKSVPLFALIVMLHAALFCFRFPSSVTRGVLESRFLARVSGTGVWSAHWVD